LDESIMESSREEMRWTPNCVSVGRAAFPTQGAQQRLAVHLLRCLWETLWATRHRAEKAKIPEWRSRDRSGAWQGWPQDRRKVVSAE
jgi:hypothetical protein